MVGPGVKVAGRGGRIQWCGGRAAKGACLLPARMARGQEYRPRTCDLGDLVQYGAMEA